MDALILVGVLLVLTAWVAAPLYGRDAASATDDATRARLDALLGRLRELEVDHASGLVTDDRYAQQRAETEAEAARLTQRLDQVDPNGTD